MIAKSQGGTTMASSSILVDPIQRLGERRRERPDLVGSGLMLA